MARNDFDYCMICDALPCKCFAKKKAARAPLGKIPAPVVRSTTEPAPTRARPNLSTVKAVKSADELEFERAITVLAGADLLHADHLVEYRDVIDLPDHRIAAMIWRQRAQN